MTLAELLANTEPDGECLLWAGVIQTTKEHRYGVLTSREPLPFGVGKRMGPSWRALVHRLSWVLANRRAIPPGMYVCHSCDVPRCVNPAHLWLGTPTQNVHDAIAKGRIALRTHCRRGHSEYVEYGNGKRRCAACHRQNQAKYKAERGRQNTPFERDVDNQLRRRARALRLADDAAFEAQ